MIQALTSEQNSTTFTKSLEAIAMLTEASLILKMIPEDSQKEKLKKFIKRFNHKYLSNIDHRIIIPFRHEPHDKAESDYVVQLIEEECSCFPTRKRVPYRIIIETIDIRELTKKWPDEKLFTTEKVEPDSDRDLFSEVTEAVDKIYQLTYQNAPTDHHKLFAVDTEESKKVSGSHCSSQN